MKGAILLAGCLLFAGCGPWISPVTAPPPSGVAEYKYVDDLIRVSEGVAYAFECSQNGPCSDLATEVADPKIALAYLGHLTVPERWSNGHRNVTAFVVVGQSAGRTELTVRNGTSAKKFIIEVLPAVQVSAPAPASPPPAAAPPAAEPAPITPPSAPSSPPAPAASAATPPASSATPRGR